MPSGLKPGALMVGFGFRVIGVRVRNKMNNIDVRKRGSYSVAGLVILSCEKITTVVILSRDRITTVVILLR